MINFCIYRLVFVSRTRPFLFFFYLSLASPLWVSLFLPPCSVPYFRLCLLVYRCPFLSGFSWVSHFSKLYCHVSTVLFVRGILLSHHSVSFLFLCIFPKMSRNSRSVRAAEAHTKKKESVALYLVFTESTVSHLQVAVPMPWSRLLPCTANINPTLPG